MSKEKYQVLLVGGGEKLLELLNTLLPVSDYERARYAANAGAARRLAVTERVDIAIINTPLPDDFGTELALDLSTGTTAVLLLVSRDMQDQIAARVEDSGVLTLGKPTTRRELYAAVKLLTAVTARLGMMEQKNRSLREKMEDIRAVNRAKWLLIEHMRMTEQEAHYFIEKQAMDRRQTRREVAEGIIRSWDK